MSQGRRRTPLPPDWERRRLQVAHRDQWTCQLQYPGCLGHCPPQRGGECDHIGEPDDHRLESLQWACRPCHATKTGRDARATQPSRRRPTEPHPGLAG